MTPLAVMGFMAPAMATQAPPVPVVVELFTSEGCSSCPPADALLAELIAKQPVKGATIIGLSEHVDYWDSLGWKDPFSDAKFSARQSAYGTAGAAQEIYTPQMIVDGTRRFAGHDRLAALDAIVRAATKPKAALQLSWSATPPEGPDARTRAPLLDVHIVANAPSSNARVWLAVTEDGLTSAVDRGENRGRTLRHSGVTRRLIDIGRPQRRL